MKKRYVKLNSITIKKVDNAYDFQVQDIHRIIAKTPDSKTAFLTSNCALDASHPQIKDFITVKQQSNRLTKFNLSILIPDRFMKAVEHDEMWQLQFPDTNYAGYKDQWHGDLERWITEGKPTIIYEQFPARELWDLIMLSTYNRNEPGVLFYDNINDYHPANYVEKILTTNPCGEIPQASNVCNLAHINLTRFYNKEDNSFDFEQFSQVVQNGVFFLDNVCEIGNVPLEEYNQKIQDYRKIGLGVMGLGSLLMMMGIKFGSYQAIEITKKIFKTKAQIELLTSAMIGKFKGSFGKFDPEKYYNTKWWLELDIDYVVKRNIQNAGAMRNSVHSSVAPTGNSSIFAGQVSNGIEPVFMREYTRWVVMTTEQKEQLQEQLQQKLPDPALGEWFETSEFKFEIRGDEQILRGQIDGKVYEIDKNRGLVKSMQVRDYGWNYILENDLSDKGVVEIDELTVQQHLNMLAASGKYINQNQSKTINIPQDYSYEDFKNVYMQAWKRKIKGITTYRAGTMTAVIEKKKTDEEYQSQLEKLYKQNKDGVIFADVKIPNKSYALQFKVKDKNRKKWYFTICFADKELTIPFALFIRTNNRESNQVTDALIKSMQQLLLKAGIKEELIQAQRQKYAGQTNVDKIGRAIGMALRHNVPLVDIVDTLQTQADGLSTLLFHVKKLLSQYIKDGTKVSDKLCDQCGLEAITYQGGCQVCANCGYSRCS